MSRLIRAQIAVLTSRMEQKQSLFFEEAAEAIYAEVWGDGGSALARVGFLKVFSSLLQKMYEEGFEDGKKARIQ